jgi:nitroreductase
MPSSLPAPIAFGEPCPIRPSPETLVLLAERRSSSAVNLRAPGPSADQLSDLLRIGGRAPDHGKLFPWRFIVLEGEGKAAYVRALEAIADDHDHPKKALEKLSTPPLAIVVVSKAEDGGKIPEWEQLLSAGAVCTLLLVAAEAMGFGANWITDWYAYDKHARKALGLHKHERIAGFVYIGAASEQPLERVRPEPGALIERFVP